jgi:anti-anti-sigma regulatory factor
MATVFRYGNPAVELAGAQVRSQCRQLATVVAVSGAITEKNVDQLIRHVTRSIISEKPYVLDLSAVTSFAPIAMSLLTAVDEACRRTGDEWILIPSPPVAQILRTSSTALYPTADSVPDALQCFSDIITERRRLLPVLAKSA